jgi:serine protease
MVNNTPLLALKHCDWKNCEMAAPHWLKGWVKSLLILFVCGLLSSIVTGCAIPSTQFGASAQFDSAILNFRDNATPAQIEAIAQKYHFNAYLNSPSAFAQSAKVYELPLGSRDRSQLRRFLRQLTAEDLIEYAEPNVLFQTTFVPNDELYSQQWNLAAIQMPQAWDLTHGEGVTVAVIDTGVTRVPDLAETEFVRGFDFVDNDDDPTDLQGHGTHVAGTIAQSTNNRLGVAGVAYKAKIMPIRVLDANGTGTVADIAEGIRFAADNGATAINLSLGGRAGAQLMQEAMQYAHQKGVTVVAAAGNDGSSQVGYPARYPEVIGVSALGPTNEKAPYSNYGTGVDISAPGGAKTTDHPEWGILQQTINRRNPNLAEFAYFQGTSMATPHVTAVAALIQAQGTTDPDEVRAVLKRSATPVQNDKLNYFGAGRLNALQAVQRTAGSEDNIFVHWFKDFLRYLDSNGYLSPRFWFDGGAVMLVPKLIMVIGGYLIHVLVRWWLAPKRWLLSFPSLMGVIVGSSGFFCLQGLRVFGLPEWPFLLMGSSVPELGTAFSQSMALNPITASVAIAFLAAAFFLGHRVWRWAVVGLCCGMAAHLLLSSTIFYTGVVWLNAAGLGRVFLVINGLLCLLLGYLAAKASTESSSSAVALR